MKRNARIAAVILAAAVLLSALAACSSGSGASYAPVLAVNWGLSLPPEAEWKLLYETDSGPDFHGDGFRYHVYSYQKEDAVAGMTAWSQEDHATIFSDGIFEAAADWLDRLNVPEPKRPDFAACAVWWYAAQDDSSEIILLLDEGSDRLYVLESFL